MLQQGRLERRHGDADVAQDVAKRVVVLRQFGGERASGGKPRASFLRRAWCGGCRDSSSPPAHLRLRRDGLGKVPLVSLVRRLQHKREGVKQQHGSRAGNSHVQMMSEGVRTGLAPGFEGGFEGGRG